MTDKKDPTNEFTIDDILVPSAIEYMMVPGAIKGKDVWIQSLPAGDMMDFRDTIDGPAKKTAALRLIIKSIVNNPTEGKRMLKDEHISFLRKLQEREIHALGKAILKLNGLDDDAKNG